MLPLHNTRGKTSRFQTTRRTRRWFCILAAILLSGILVLHPLAPDEWREAALEQIKIVQGPLWPGRRPSSVWDERAQHVKDAFIGAYGHYRKYAFGADEVFPLSNQPRNKCAHSHSIFALIIKAYFSFNGWGVSIVDSIDTMILMNLTLQYEQAKEHVSTIDFTHGSGGYVPFFEAIIRYLGGLLSAYSLTEDPIFLSKADDIGRALLPAFDTTSGLPAFAVDPVTKETLNQYWNGGMSLLSEMVSWVHLSVLPLTQARPNQYTPGFVSA